VRVAFLILALIWTWLSALPAWHIVADAEDSTQAANERAEHVLLPRIGSLELAREIKPRRLTDTQRDTWHFALRASDFSSGAWLAANQARTALPGASSVIPTRGGRYEPSEPRAPPRREA
jgi:hypothetical protein